MLYLPVRFTHCLHFQEIGICSEIGVDILRQGGSAADGKLLNGCYLTFSSS